MVAILVGVLAFVGSFLGNWWSRKSDKELDAWRRREETMRTIRWAADRATEGTKQRTSLGVGVLGALSRAEILQPEDQELLNDVYAVVVRPVVSTADVEFHDTDYTKGDEGSKGGDYGSAHADS